ncbi:prepilin-type N-terminal cleavage/methylation domain-containing protein [Stutzerimonas stutzeri]|uniref:prepilin-type N-terminal cleavage/methylation domain-containing protein n=1 Tax=Stutzerimonas stutzeri TaxID=316 RepID=UPI0034D56BAB
MKTHRALQGFTMIEVLIVTAIVGIITALSLPLLQNYRSKSSDVVAHTDARNAIGLLLANKAL